MTDTLNWGLLGAGNIAKAFAKGVATSETGRVVAVGSRDQEKADRYVGELGLDGVKGHGSYDALLADEDVHAVYIATPHPMHAEWAIKAAEAGKHILCEKPVGLNHAEASAMIEAARQAGVFFMEAFMYRCHPQTAKLVEMIKAGAVGQVQLIDAAFAFRTGSVDPKSRFFDPELGGGGILDVGSYTTSAARLIAGAAIGKPFAEPTEVKAVGHLGETGVDEWTVATLKFDGPDEQAILATCTTGVRLSRSHLTVVGTEGHLTVDSPWIPARDGGTTTITLHRGTSKDAIEVNTTVGLYGLEADVCARAIGAGKLEADAPAMTWDDTLSNMRTLDAWRREIELTYPGETAAGFTRPLSGRPVGPGDNPPMTFRELPGLDRPVSRMVMGCDNKDRFADAAVIWDAWLECGGNTFDTAHVYGRPKQRLMGDYLKSRGVRDRVNLICKGAHTPNCNPDGLTRELNESLDDFGVEKVDIYIMHRDNPDVPVGEFVDVLHDHAEAGRIGVFGGSNWSIERFQEANRYAEQNGKRKMTVLSNNFSLARMVHPVWAGCIAASDPDSRAFLEQTQTANFAWSSQARGYFVSRDATGMIVYGTNNWDSEDNRRRRERAFELAEKHGVTAINIAAAYVLCQDFPSFALIGPRTLKELHTSLPALNVKLSAEELAYLDLRD